MNGSLAPTLEVMHTAHNLFSWRIGLQRLESGTYGDIWIDGECGPGLFS